MIHDKTLPPPPVPRDWAVFRYGLISAATRPLHDEVCSQILARVAATQHQQPDGTLRRFSVSCLRSWLKKYQEGGLDALLPKTRSDKGTFRAIDEDTAELIARYRVQNRSLSVKLFWQVLHDDGVLPQGVTVCEATLRRFLKSRNLARPVRGPGKARAKYEMPYPNDLWVADYMHGPRVGAAGGKRKAILCAIIDDHSRVIVGARFSFSEETGDILETLRDAVAVYGVPKRLYCDNGPAFGAGHLKEACARIGCTVLHSEPFDSPSRGKIERWFRTVRARFLPVLKAEDLVSLASLNERFEPWLRQDYHLRRHGGIGAKPLDRYLCAAEKTLIQRLGSEEIDHAFMGRLTRLVRNDATVKVAGVFYEVPPEFIRARVELRFPVGKPERLTLYRDDEPVCPLKPVDLVDNARFHARPVAVSYHQLAGQSPQEEP